MARKIVDFRIHPKDTYASPRWSFEIADCSVPMTFDQYGKCFYQCFYCFSAFRKAIGVGKEHYADENQVTAVKPENVKRFFTNLDDPRNQFRHYVEDRRVLQWGGLADPFCEFERRFGVGLEIMRFLADMNYPITYSTKGTWWTQDRRYVELFEGRKNWNVKVSIITMDERLASVAERFAPSCKQRLNAIERIAGWDSGGVTLRLRPFVLGMSNPSHVELIKEAAKRGATALSTEFACLETRSPHLRARLPEINKLLGYNLINFYKKYSYSQGYLRLNRKVKRPFVDQMEQACKDCGMRFYVSDAHFKERCANGSCCGLPPEWNYCRGQWCEALQIAKRVATHEVLWGDMDHHLRYADWTYRKSYSMNTQSVEHRAKFHNFTMRQYLRWIWNHPDNGQSPYRMYEGILKPCRKDLAGNVVYRYDPGRE